MLRGSIILRDISRGLELHLLNAVLGQHYTKIVFPTNATRYTQLSRTQFSFAWVGCAEYRKNGLTKLSHTEPVDIWNPGILLSTLNVGGDSL